MIFLFLLVFFFAVTQSYALDVTLQWDPNTEPDLAGYKIYYGTESGNYNGTNATGTCEPDCDSPISVPTGSLGDQNNPGFTLTGLDDSEVYFFVVTAFDTEGLYSGYSNELNRFAELFQSSA